VTWGLIMGAGWETTVCPRVPSAPWPATTRCLLSVWRGRSPATWALTLGAGWEISATTLMRDSSVLQCATSPLPPYVRRARSCATWALMPITAGWETTACPRAANVQHIIDQITDVLPKYIFSGKITFYIHLEIKTYY